MKIKLNSQGQTLIEATVAIAVASIVVGAIAMAIVTSMNNARFSQSQNLATQYAQQGMDMLRQESESYWAIFTGYPAGTYCFGLGSLVLAPDCNVANINSTYLRKVIINKTSVDCSVEKASVSVSWSDSKCASGEFCHTVSLDSCFTQGSTVSWP